MIVHQDQAMPQGVSGQISHVTARDSPIVQPKRTGQKSLLTQTEKLLTPETQDQLNLEAMTREAMKQEDLASLQDHLIVALVQDQDLDTVQIHLSVQPAMIAASDQIVQQGISPAILSVALQGTRQEIRQETLAELTSHVQTRESMTAIATRTAKTEFQETSLVTPALLALAIRTQTAKHSLRTRF
jgi:phage-related baseplate assembly protein